MKLADFNPWWSQRTLREKLMLGVGIVGAVAMASDALLTAPLQRELRRAQSQLGALQARWTEAQAKQAPGGAVASAEQQAQWRERAEAARQQLAAVDRQAGEAARLPEALRTLTATMGTTRLMALDLSPDAAAGSARKPGSPTGTAAPAPATPSAPSAATPADAAVAGGPRLYRLPITIKLSGSYDELQSALRQIETQATQLHWTSMVLDGKDWPAIELTLKAHVLSRQPRWGATS